MRIFGFLLISLFKINKQFTLFQTTPTQENPGMDMRPMSNSTTISIDEIGKYIQKKETLQLLMDPYLSIYMKLRMIQEMDPTDYGWNIFRGGLGHQDDWF